MTNGSAEVRIAARARADDAAWDRHWSGCAHATFYQSRAWARAWVEYMAGRQHASPVLYRFSDGLEAVFADSVATSQRGLVRTHVSSPGGTYGGWVSADALTDRHVALLARDIRSTCADLFWRVTPYDEAAGRAVEDAGATAEETDTLDLTPGFEAVFRSWSKGHSSAAKKARREGVTVRPAEGEPDWRAYYLVYEDSLRRWGDAATSRYEWELFDALRRCSAEGVRLWLAEHSGRVVAGAVCLLGTRHVGYWHGAALEEFFPLRPVHFLLHEVIRDACGRGFRWFDFNPSGGHESLRTFKKGFGTVALPCPVIEQKGAWSSAVERAARLLKGGRA